MTGFACIYIVEISICGSVKHNTHTHSDHERVIWRALALSSEVINPLHPLEILSVGEGASMCVRERERTGESGLFSSLISREKREKGPG